MAGRFLTVPCLLVAFLAAGCVDDDLGEWVKYELDDPNLGASCGNGDPYAFYVQFSESGSENLIVYFQAGGVCWDYASCVPGAEPAARDAVNLDGLPDDYANMHERINLDSPIGGGTIEIRPNVKVIYPLLNDDAAISPMSDWNKVFLPYCTGDAHAGTSIVTYEDPANLAPDVEFRHVGHLNVLAAIDMLDGMFSRVDKLFVGGGSAGGIGAVVNYYFLRTGLNVEGESYLFNDAGPIYSAPSRTRPLYDLIRAAWGVDGLIDGGLPSPDVIKADFGALNTVLADSFPNDRMVAAFYRLDFNITLYSYERFYQFESGVISEIDATDTPPPGLDENTAADRTAFYSLWWDDITSLRAQYDGRQNLGYFIPYWRQTNDSHLTALPGAEESDLNELATNLIEWFVGLDGELELNPELVWKGTEFNTPDGRLDIRDYVDVLLDDQATLPSYFADVDQATGPFVPCTPRDGGSPLMPVAVDSAACETVASSP